MDKIRFERFINKYNLSGTCESIVILSQNNTSKVSCISADRDVLIEVVDTKSNLPNGKYPIFETQKFRSMMNVLGDTFDVTLKLASDNTTPLVLNMNDTVFDVNFALCDESVLPTVPHIVNPPYVLTIPLTVDFINNFIKAKNALGDVETFVIKTKSNSNKIEFVIGDSSINSNLIKLSANSNETHMLSPLVFSAKIFKNIMYANKDAGTGTMLLSSDGMANVSFDVDGITSTYYLVAK